MGNWFDLGSVIDLSPMYNLLFFGIMLLAGILAFKMLPKGLNIIMGFGLMALGVLELMGIMDVV